TPTSRLHTLSLHDALPILTELGGDPESFKLVDWRLNYARDLYQAATAPKPCTAFRDTLDHIAKSKDVYYVEHVINSKLEPPAARSEEHTSELQSREKLVCR